MIMAVEVCPTDRVLDDRVQTMLSGHDLRCTEQELGRMTKGLMSLIVPTYNTGRYLPAFLRSLTLQTYPLEDLEIIFVNDGSTDNSPLLISEWIEGEAPHAAIINQDNSGLSEARNTGLAEATNTWVTFPDPDDVLDENYFQSVANAIPAATKSGVDLIATNILFLRGHEESIHDSHPLKFRFQSDATRIIDLDRHPEYIHLSAATGFYKRELLERGNLRFSSKVKPNFEDGHLSGRYLLQSERLRIAFVFGAKYHYRKRLDSTSLTQESWHDPDKYVTVLKEGYLDLLKQASKAEGRPPLWLQNLVLYDLMQYFRAAERGDLTAIPFPDAIGDEFFRLCKEIFAYVDEDAILGYKITRVDVFLRRALVIGFKRETYEPTHVELDKIDQRQQIGRAIYHYKGERPQENIRSRGYAVRPIHEKIRSVEILGRELHRERILWLPTTGSLSVSLNDRRVPIRFGQEPEPIFVVGPTAIRRGLGSDDFNAARKQHADPAMPASELSPLASAGQRALKKITRITRRVRAYGLTLSSTDSSASPPQGAWILTDGTDTPRGLAEQLYRRLAETRKADGPAILYLLQPSSPEWRRLKADGFDLLACGGTAHSTALMTCDCIISSSTDASQWQDDNGRPASPLIVIVSPDTSNGFTVRYQRLDADLILTGSSELERSLTRDGTLSQFTTKEVRYLSALDRGLRNTPPQEMTTDASAAIVETIGRAMEALPYSHAYKRVSRDASPYS